MRKIYFVLGAALLLCLFSACSNSDKQHEEDSIRRADSIAAIEAAEKAAEEARLDSIRQDSIEKAEKIIASIPTFSEVDRGNFATLFKKKGFEISYKKGKVWDNEVLDFVPYNNTIASLNKGGEPSCLFVENDNGWTMTINGAPELLDKFASDAKNNVAKLKRENKGDWYFEAFKVTVSGNSVKMYWPTGD